MINSPSHLVTATPNCSIRKGLHCQERTFSRSYGSILPSSFTRVLSSALVFSTYPPVLVWGTVDVNLTLETFPGSRASIASLSRSSASYSYLRVNMSPDLPKLTPYILKPALPIAGQPSLLRHPIEIYISAGILTCFPSTTLFSLALGADSPCAD